MTTKIDIVTLQSLLESREGLPLRYAALIALTVAHDFSPELLDGVQAWMDGTLTADFAAADCSLQDIMDDTGAGLFEALCMLNLQLSHPERIEDALWVLRGDELLGLGEQ